MKAELSRPGERGVALLLALLTMVLLTVVVVEFTFATQVGYRRAATWLLAKRAALIAEGGIILASEVLAQDYFIDPYVDSLADLWARELPPIDTGSGRLLVRIEDEQGRFNLNSLVLRSRSAQWQSYRTLLQILNLDPALVEPVGDWIDRDKQPGGNAGAEDAYYSALERPYTARNGQLQSFAELALVRGYDPMVLATLRPLVTALPLDDTKINPNTAPALVLRSLHPHLADETLVTNLIEHRRLQPFKKLEDVLKVDGMDVFGDTDQLGKLFSVASQYFRVRSTGEVDGVFQSVEALLYRENGKVYVLYQMARRGPNIVGVDLAATARIDDTSLIGVTR
ncbi:MAG TPA: type II secretion system minor pseudopilin GspK [Candidatus Binatia bacterium]|nr:type II secretion system minor pseudopilin GspK [Candidatus Binatia bacterium]